MASLIDVSRRLLRIQYSSLPNVADLPAGATVVNSLFGPMVAFDGDLITSQLIDFGAHTRNELSMLLTFLDGGDLVYDLGAHIGTFAIPFAAAVGPGGQIVCVEPILAHFDLLLANIRARGLDNVTTIRAAVGNPDDTYCVRAKPENTGASYLVRVSAGSSIPTETFGALHARTNAGRRTALIKVVVQGMEETVLRAAAPIIERDRPILYIQVVPEQLRRHDGSAAGIDSLLREHDYRFFRNVGARNSSNDTFEIAELENVADGGTFFDLLALHANDAKLARFGLQTGHH